jgi:long-chain acyl-CoA synthetase
MLLYDTLLNSAQAAPQRTALMYRDIRVSYSELAGKVRRLASRIQVLGVRRGDRVAILLDNSPEFIYGYFAGLLAGAVLVPTNTFLVNPEIDYIYRDADISLLLTGDRFAERIKPILQGFPNLKAVMVAAGESSPMPGTGDTPPFLDLNTEISLGDPRFHPEQTDLEGGLAVLQYTSGTTGKPKGVMLSHHNLVSNAIAVSKATEIIDGDRFVLALPAFHSFSQTVCVITAMVTGTGISVVPRIDRAELGYSLINHRPTIFPGVPALFHMLSMAPAPPPEMNPVRLYISGGAPLPMPVQMRFEENYKKPIYEGYGLTEASPVVSWNLPGHNRPGSVGMPITGVQVKVTDEMGNPAPTDTVGELCVRSDSVMMGYYKLEQDTASAIVEGWLRTGDMARIDADGYITIVERKKDLIIHKGLNVYPSEVEAVLLQCREIAEVAVVGAYDGANGEVPEAFIVFHPDLSVPEAELKRLCKENLAAYKIPRRFHYAPQLPKTSTGKIRKTELKTGLQPRGEAG